VVEVDELEKKDNVLEVEEVIRLKLEGKRVSGSEKRVVVYGPGATKAEYILSKS
jgi:hypothetical protein